MNVSYSVMAHSSRRDMVNSLLQVLGEKTPVVWDRNNDIWDTCRRAWELHNPNADFHLVLQDDSILCENFLGEIKKLPKNDVIYSLYLGNRPRFRGLVEAARQNGESFVVLKNIYHEIALMFPVKRIRGMLSFCDAQRSKTDKVINEYVKKEGLNVFFPLPTLVDHRPGKSLHDENTSELEMRRSVWFKH